MSRYLTFPGATAAALLFLAASAPLFAEIWKDDALAAPGAASRLLVEEKKASSLEAALALLEPNAAKLPQGDGKREVYCELARLRELAGNLEGASAAWISAADSGQYRSDFALVEAARCLVSIGETERAAEELRLVLLTGRDPVELRKARYLSVQLAVFRGESDGITLLKSFLSADDYREREASTLYLLFVMTGDEQYRAKLLSSWPESLEARVAGDRKKTDSVSLKTTPLWLLFPGRASVTLVSPAVVPERSADTTKPTASPLGGSPASTGIIFQVGLFRRETNARDLGKRLSGKGFSVHVDQRQVSGQNCWVVTVDGGKTPQDTALRLKDEGVEAFPL